MKRLLRLLRRHWILSTLLVINLALILFVGYRMKGPYRFYKVDFVNTGNGEAPGTLEVGVAKVDITPDMSQYDPWTDADNNGRYDPDKGDTYEDRNGNGKFDAVWMAGFSMNRPAKGVHDPLWARAVAFRNNGVTVAMVTIDSIGIFHEKFIEVRKSIDPALGIDHVMFSSLHNHEAPDTMGIWSYTIPPHFDHGYMALVQRACKQAVEEAVADLQPAETILAEVETPPEDFVDDSRKPLVYDNVIRAARFVKPGTDETIATVVEWGNHPETLGSKNSELTSDFCHYWREGVEKGVGEPNGVEGLGGMCLYFQGLVGGLMTQLHTTVPHRNGVDKFEKGTFEKAEALGENLAILTVKALRGDTAWRPTEQAVAVAAKTIYVPVEGLYSWVAMLGVLHPGWFWWDKVRTEVDVIRVGDIEILTVPGELYPEIVDGGIEAPEGADFACAPIEIPPLRSKMHGKMNMVIGLANDEIGYIIPKSQWDVEPPYAYGRTNKPQYGEDNSFGPNVAVVLHRESLALLERMK